MIHRFFGNFSEEHNSELKERFLRLWSRMSDIYHAFNERLAAQGLAYEGALYREVAEQQHLDFDYDTYVFVGFNMVQQVEQRLFKMLQQQGKARFYWDFDHYYMKPQANGIRNEAGHYISQLLADFPNELDNNDGQIYSQFSQPKSISYMSAPTENIQARYVGHWLQQKGRAEAGRQTAVVMCDEGLLQTIIHCLPDAVEKVNITTGYPLIQSPLSSFTMSLLSLQLNGWMPERQRFRQHQLNAVLRHPYMAYFTDEEDQLHTVLCQLEKGDNAALLTWLCDIMQLIARRADTDDPLFQESVFRMYTLLNRLLTLVNSGDLQADANTLERLIRQLISSTSVPFHGEPAEGLQVMGVLETRNLDFDHLLILSCNEGNMPKGVSDTSFIPYSIRKAFGLTTIDHKVSIYSYYFHRLLSRASDVTITYNNATTDGKTGEMSRFMLQLMVESPHHIQFHTLRANQHYTPFNPAAQPKTPEVMQLLRQRFEKKGTHAQRPLLTPTAINSYMYCQLLFYYTYVCNLREPDHNDDNAIDSLVFGNIFHEASRLIYSSMTGSGRRITKSHIEDILKSKTEVPMAVDKAIQTELFKMRQPSPDFQMQLNGLQLINREVIIHYVRQLLTLDSRLAPFSIIGLECDVVSDLNVESSGFQLTTTIGGRIDRLDQCSTDEGESLRVVDYKTGSSV